jgi:hypothetical protein
VTLLEELKGRVGTGVATACGDTLLEGILATIATDYSGATRTKTLDLAQADVCLRMATDTALWFKYSQGSESVDKTSSTTDFLAIARALWMKHGVAEQSGGSDGVATVGRTRRTEELL